MSSVLELDESYWEVTEERVVYGRSVSGASGDFTASSGSAESVFSLSISLSLEEDGQFKPGRVGSDSSSEIIDSITSEPIQVDDGVVKVSIRVVDVDEDVLVGDWDNEGAVCKSVPEDESESNSESKLESVDEDDEEEEIEISEEEEDDDEEISEEEEEDVVVVVEEDDDDERRKSLEND